MSYFSVLSTKGQVTIPQEVRTRLGLKEGDRVEFVTEGDATVIRPAREASNPFREYVGTLGAFENRDEVNRWVSELRDTDGE